MLREAIRRGTDVGSDAEKLVNAGSLVPDQLVRRMVEERLAGQDCRNGFILDGYPRSLNQARELDEILEGTGCALERVVELTLNEDEIIRRLSGRRTCNDCKTVFHVEFNRPRQKGVCDRCGKELVQRKDDGERVIRERLRVYRDTTAPLVAHYRARGLLVSISAAEAVDEVSRRIDQALEAA